MNPAHSGLGFLFPSFEEVIHLVTEERNLQLFSAFEQNLTVFHQNSLLRAVYIYVYDPLVPRGTFALYYFFSIVTPLKNRGSLI
jgi:hypothetical protein